MTLFLDSVERHAAVQLV